MPVASFLYRLFHPTIDAFLTPSLPLITRIRLLWLQPVNLLLYILKCSHRLFSQDPGYQVRDVPTRQPGLSQRCLIYNTNRASASSSLKPLHVNIHGGAFIGGLPEYDHDFCSYLVKTTGAVVVSVSYRFAPRYPFPAAIDDVDDIFAWLVAHAPAELGANPGLLTVSGFSAGANLALAASQNIQGYDGIRGAVTFYAPVDLRVPPPDKPRPQGFPDFDLLGFISPLYDAYAGPSRAARKYDPRLHPTLASLESLPKDILMIIPKFDILVDEQETFFSRLKREIEELNKAQEGGTIGRRVEKLVFEKGFHGWVEIPTFILGDKDKKIAFAAASVFIQEIHEKEGFSQRL